MPNDHVPFRHEARNNLRHVRPDQKMNDSGGPDGAPFWRKPLAQLTRTEWEQLCDGCGRCCLIKLEDEDTGEIHFTSVSCALLNDHTCRCSDYRRRQSRVPDCVRLTPDNLSSLSWLPKTCAYRLRAQGEDLPHWHPLVSGDPNSVIAAGVSVRGKIEASEADVPVEDLPDYIARWPNRWPKERRKPQKA